MRQPTFSIIIPTHKRPQQLTDCLAAISALNYPPELFEVIIVDDGQTISGELAEPFRHRLNITFHAQRQTVREHRGKSDGRSRGDSSGWAH